MKRSRSQPRQRCSTEALAHAFDGDDEAVRVVAMRGLAEIADPTSADVFAHALNSPDERVRTYAAQGLSRIGDARASAVLLQTIDDYPDALRDLLTPSALQLITRGPASLLAVAPCSPRPHLRRAPGRAQPRKADRRGRSRTRDLGFDRGEVKPYDPNAPPPVTARAIADPMTGKVRFEFVE